LVTKEADLVSKGGLKRREKGRWSGTAEGDRKIQIEKEKTQTSKKKGELHKVIKEGLSS